MIYATCINEETNYNNQDLLLSLITENIQTNIKFCMNELEILDEVNIDDQYKTKKSKFQVLKDLVTRLWKSFREFCTAKKKSLMELVDKVKAKLKIKKAQKDSNNKSKDKSSSQQDDNSEKKKILVLNDKFNKIDERKLLSSEVLDLSASLNNYNKELFENFNMNSYTESVVKDITGGEFSSVDDIKGKVLVEEKYVSEDMNDSSELDALAKKYDAMISEVDNYFNKLQDSIRKAEAKFKGQIMPTSYSDNNVSATTNNPIQTRQMQFIIQTSVKMIGAQSGIVRNIVYAKVDAISQVIASRV